MICAQTKTPVLVRTGVNVCPGDDLLSHAATHAVPSALEGLTTEFGMESGMAPPVRSPAPGCTGVLRRREYTRESSCCDDPGFDPSPVRSKKRGGGGQDERPISTTRLNVLPRLHLWPINLVFSEGPSGIPGFGVSFPLRCFQRLSVPDLATRQCRWRDNRHTRGPSTLVLSY